MNSGQSVAMPAPRRELPSLRDAADTLFRHSRWILSLCIFLTVALGLYVWKSPRTYEAEMTILVRNMRADMVVTPDGAPMTAMQTEISDTEMGTEMQLLSSRELFLKVVDECRLGGSAPASRERAADKLLKKVRIAPLMKSSMIRVRYSSPDASLSARVLQSLADGYFERHMQIHSTSGSFAFFQQQAEVYERKLHDAEEKLLQFQRNSGVVGAPERKELLVRKVVEVQAELREAEANLSEARQRIATLREQRTAEAPRIATQQRVIPNQYSVERLNTLMTELRNKRTELLTKFQPGDRMVKQIDQQMADTQKALDRAEKLNSTEEATDVNPLRQTIDTELARAEAAANGLTGRIDALSQQTRQYRAELGGLEGMLPDEQELLREIKAAEDNYVLYSKKREEARILEAMDKSKIANIAIAEPPRVPVLPQPRLSGGLIGGYLLAVALIHVGALFIGQSRRTVCTPWELESFAGTPVLATVGYRPTERSAALVRVRIKTR
ncbi:MAG: Wzz/FepE/Etk N-terminal domain-containing protein [Bryobacteraceae bacterium]|jgi:uncharacterized protein involved in exopolysaccharide biosynthesis